MTDANFDRALEELKALHDAKAADYSTVQDPYSNFRLSGEQVGISAGSACEVLIATKQARLRELLSVDRARPPKNESVRDTLRDRAVYAILALNMWDEGLYNDVFTIVAEEPEFVPAQYPYTPLPSPTPRVPALPTLDTQNGDKSE